MSLACTAASAASASSRMGLDFSSSPSAIPFSTPTFSAKSEILAASASTSLAFFCASSVFSLMIAAFSLMSLSRMSTSFFFSLICFCRPSICSAAAAMVSSPLMMFCSSASRILNLPRYNVVYMSMKARKLFGVH